MAKELTAEEGARALLNIYKANGIKAGEGLIMSSVSEKFYDDGGSVKEFNQAIEYMVQHKWVENGGANFMLITDAGYAAI
ncbi:hypothetical protein [Asticcacaulis sp. 201]|uniref:hypothetical protein n=1 Tax=Asticcacaulis sp. 201 TaxID=3028787 RepID=UPI00291656D1|nr:hypothetical protein [Asticcacaulis sp. 201]MDV6333235.1 hypothetical protein [Asticcacaulis sp. 201]